MRFSTFAPQVAAGSMALAAISCASTQKPLLEQPVGMTHAETPAPVGVVDEEQSEPVPKAKTRPQGEPNQTPYYRLCDLPDTAEEDPHFAVDSVSLDRRGGQILDQIARCMLHGALRGKSVIILGYADPRGSKEYNLDLAMGRARTARYYLLNRGVPPSRVTIASRGEHYARGHGPESWRLDRRIEIELDTGEAVERF